MLATTTTVLLRVRGLRENGKKGKCVGDDEEDLLLLLPEDFLIQILVRLPVVSLLRFKSVCKSWCALIQASFFIDLHTTFNFSSSSSKQQQQQQLGGDSSSTFILQASGVLSGGSEFLVLSCDNNKKSDEDEDEDEDDDEVVFKLDDLEHPLLRYNSDIVRLSYIAGSCNGLICLHDLYHLKDFFLCNPATRQSKILPKPITSFSDYDVVFCYLVGFGFDVETKDYKVLLITYSTPKYIGGSGQLEYLCKVEVYSLSSNSWRLLKGINSLPGVLRQERSLYHPGICLNGSYFFVGCKLSFESYYYENCLIISFDFTKEIFTTRQFPLQFPDHHDHAVQRFYLSCLGEKLALFAIRDYKNYEDCDYWVLNEHGSGGVTKGSWTKLHSFQIKTGARELIMPRGILNNGEFALLETRSKDETTKKMQLYNLVTKEAKTDFLICERMKTIEVYKPSLVSIIGGNGAAEAAASTTDRVIGGAI